MLHCLKFCKNLLLFNIQNRNDGDDGDYDGGDDDDDDPDQTKIELVPSNKNERFDLDESKPCTFSPDNDQQDAEIYRTLTSSGCTETAQTLVVTNNEVGQLSGKRLLEVSTEHDKSDDNFNLASKIPNSGNPCFSNSSQLSNCIKASGTSQEPMQSVLKKSKNVLMVYNKFTNKTHKVVTIVNRLTKKTHVLTLPSTDAAHSTQNEGSMLPLPSSELVSDYGNDSSKFVHDYLVRPMEPELPRTFKCEICDNLFPSMWVLEMHQTNIHSVGKERSEVVQL